MKKHPALLAYILIGVGLYFVVRQYDIPFLSHFDTWPTFIIIAGIGIIIHSVFSSDSQYLLSGIIVLGIGIHFHGQLHYPGWIDHWAVYILILGAAITIRYVKTKKGLVTGLLLMGLSVMFIYSISVPHWLEWLYFVEHLETVWPFLLIIIGVYLLTKK